MSIGKRIEKARKDAGWSQTRLASEINTGQTTISSWERGRTEPTREDVQRIAERLRVPVAALELIDNAADAVQTVPLIGYVGAGSEAHFYATADEGLGDVEAPAHSTNSTRAAEIRGQSLGPLFERWLIYFDDIRAPVTPDLLGELCVVGLPNSQVLVKKLQRSRTPGLYHLLSNNEAPMLDQEVVWAAKVKTMRPR